MIFGFAILATALLLSAVAAYYSVAGLVAIFSAATIPVIIMGGSLELGKIAATVWLHNNWRRAGWAFKAYLIPAVAFLMILTSMGIFGYLSKAHSDQSLVSGDVQAKIAIYDEKIKIERENIDANRKALKQLDEAVDQIMGRSTSETGAEKAVQIRRSQQAERGRLLREIEQSQKRIGALNEERAPIAAEVRKVEAEVGPIKYIAALVYGDNPDTNLLERAVRWMIIMIVLVFDPLALALILAANKQFEWVRQGRGGWDHDDPKYPADDGALTDEQMQQLQQHLDQKRAVARALDSGDELPVPAQDIITQPTDHHPDTHPYLHKGFVYPEGWLFEKPVVANVPVPELDDDQENDPDVKAAIKRWKLMNPNSTLKEERRKFARQEIDRLPWLDAKYTSTSFGTQFPSSPERGDIFVKTDRMPGQLYKFNGNEWIVIDKNNTDHYTYDTAYIDYLVEKISTGEYDPDLLSDAERDQIAERLKQTKPQA
jgi:hypothetical protein